MTHPLDQITSDEINKAADLCKSHEGLMKILFLSISVWLNLRRHLLELISQVKSSQGN